MLQKLKAFFAPIDLTSGTPWKRIVQFAIPVFLSVLLANAFSLINSVVLKYTVGGDSVTAMNSMNPITNLLFNCAYGFTGGFAVISSNALGSKDNDKLKTSFHSSLLLVLIIGLIITIVGVCLSNWFLTILNVNERFAEQARNYLIVMMSGFIFILMNNYLTNFLRALGNSIIPLVYSILQMII